MNKLVKLKKKKAEKLERLQKLFEISESNEKGLSEEEAAEKDQIKADIKSINAKIEDLEYLEQEQVKDITDDNNSDKNNDDVNKTGVEVTGKVEKLEKGLHAGSYIRCLAAAKQMGISPLDFAKKAYGERHPVRKTLSAGSGAGSNTIPADVADEIIELLRNKTVIRQMNPRGISMDHGSIDVTRQTGSVNAAYVGENTALNASDMTTDQVNLALKKIMAVTSVTKELLSYSVHNVDGLVRDDLIEALRDAENAQLIRGTGSSNAPTSLLEIATAASQVHSAASGATPNIAAVELVLKTLIQYLEGSNVSTVGAYWKFNSRIKNFLMFFRDPNGNRAFPEMRDGLLLDKPFLDTEAIPGNLGAGTNESEIYLTQPKGLYLADGSMMEISSTDTGSYQVGGNLKSTFADDSVAFKVTQKHDFNARHANATAVADSVQWGS